MELGSNSPVIVLPDADLEKAANAIIATRYSNAGQVCSGAQRILTHEKVCGDLLTPNGQPAGRRNAGRSNAAGGRGCPPRALDS